MMTAWPELWPLAVAGGALDEWVEVGDAGLLGRLRDAVNVAAEGDHRRAGAPARHPGGGDAGDPLLDLETVVPEDAGEVAGGLDLLEPEFAEAEDGVHDHLRQLGAFGGALVGDGAEGFGVLGGGGGQRERAAEGRQGGGFRDAGRHGGASGRGVVERVGDSTGGAAPDSCASERTARSLKR